MTHLKTSKYLASERSGLLRVAKLNTKKHVSSQHKSKFPWQQARLKSERRQQARGGHIINNKSPKCLSLIADLF